MLQFAVKRTKCIKYVPRKLPRENEATHLRNGIKRAEFFSFVDASARPSAPVMLLSAVASAPRLGRRLLPQIRYKYTTRLMPAELNPRAKRQTKLLDKVLREKALLEEAQRSQTQPPPQKAAQRSQTQPAPQKVAQRSQTQSPQKKSGQRRGQHATAPNSSSKPQKPPGNVRQPKEKKVDSLKSAHDYVSQHSSQMEYPLCKLRDELGKKLPTQKELPGMRQPPFRDPKGCLQVACRTLNISTHDAYDTLTGRPEPLHHKVFYMRHTRELHIPGYDKIVAVGDGLAVSIDGAKRGAQTASAINALGEMHRAGLLAIAFGMTKITGQMQKEAKDGLIDVFNYAARYDCLLHYSAQLGTCNLMFVQLEMPEQNIKVSVRGRSLSEAEILAIVEFKRQAERYHLEQGTDPFAVNDPTVLNTNNVAKFLLHCQKTVTISVTRTNSKSQNGREYSYYIGQARMNDQALGPPVSVCQGGESTATKITQLVAALSLAKEHPHLLESFKTDLRAGATSSNKAQLIPLSVSRGTMRQMAMLNKSTHYSNEQKRAANAKETEQDHARPFRRAPMLTGSELREKSILLQEKMASYQNRPDLEQLRFARSQLPMSQYADQVREIVQNNIYCVIVGATGSGKTTQVPQILLDQAIQDGTGASCNVICTQPRRIAATSVARRVADERAEKLQDTVGYHVRFDVKPPKPSGSILFCTTGILLQQLQHAHDEVYDRVSHLVIDEVHERDILIDFLLVILKKTMALRVAQGKKVPRVVLMSATIDAKRFSEYFKDSLPLEEPTDCPSLSVPGRTFPVQYRHLDDILKELKGNHHQPTALQLLLSEKDTKAYLAAEKPKSINLVNTRTAKVKPKPVIDWKANVAPASGGDEVSDSKEEALVPLGLAAATVAHIAKTTTGGAILVFLPGLQEITKLDDYLRRRMPLDVDFGDEAKFKIFMLHSSIPDQRSVFDSLPNDCRKIILSTNIAETSVTIPDVQYVVDTGKSREKRYDQERRLTQLQCAWISKSNVKQRAGRAGRVQNGNYYALYTESRFESMRAIGLPELLRSELQEVCLDVKAQAFKMPVREFLAEAIEPPSAAAVDIAMENLKSLGALSPEEELTPLGRVLAMLPVHPALGKMIILGIIFRCLEPMIVLGAALEERALFVNPPGQTSQANAAKRIFAKGTQSDHLMVLEAFRMACKAEARSPFALKDFCAENYLHPGAFRSIKSTASQIEDILHEAGLIPEPFPGNTVYGGSLLNQNSHSGNVIKALLLGGLNPNIAVQKPKGRKGGRAFRTRDEHFTMINQTSTNARTPDTTTSQLLTYTSLALSTDGGLVSMRDTTFVNPLMVLLFAGRISLREKGNNIIEVDEWLPFAIKVRGREFGVWDGNNTEAANRIMKFRNHLDTMLAIAFADLAKRKPLADDPVRTSLAMGLSQILRSGENLELPALELAQDGRPALQGSGWQSDEGRGHRLRPVHPGRRETTVAKRPVRAYPYYSEGGVIPGRWSMSQQHAGVENTARDSYRSWG